MNLQGFLEEKDPTDRFYTTVLDSCFKVVGGRMAEVVQDPMSDWSALTEQESQVIAERCDKLFNFLVTTPIASLREWRYSREIDLSNLVSDKDPPFDADCAKYIVERYEEKGDLDFEGEFGMTRDVMVMAMLYGVWEEKNNTNSNFTPLCDHLKLDLHTFCFLKRGLRSHIEVRDDVTAIKMGIHEAFCTPLDLAFLLTLAMAEVSQWPFKPVEWEKVTGEADAFTADDLRMFDEGLREEAMRLWNTAPQLGSNDNDTRNACQELTKEMELLKSDSEVRIQAIRKCIDRCKDVEFEEMKTAQRKKNQERLELLNNYVPQFAVENDPITKDTITDTEKVAEEASAECLRLRQLLTVKVKTLKDRFPMKKGQFCLAREDPLDIGFQEAMVVKQVNENTYVVRILKENGVADVTLGLQDIANAELPLCEPEFERIGHMALRVVAWVDVPHHGWQWCPGTIAARPISTHGFDLLVFFDYNFEGYVEGGPKLNPASREVANFKQSLMKKPRFNSQVEAFEWLKPILREMKAFPICQQAFSPCGKKLLQESVFALIEDIPTRRRFIQRYFFKHPFWPLVRMKKPTAERPPQQVLCVDPLQNTTAQIMAYCVHVDRHMCVLRFQQKPITPGAGCFEYPCLERTHIHRDEWLYRGSPRLKAVNIEDDDNSNLSSRQKMRNKKKFEPSSTFQQPAEANRIFLARKSGAPQAEAARLKNSVAEAAKKKRDKEKAKQFVLAPVCLPTSLNLPHDDHDCCSRGCLQGLDRLPLDKDFQGKSPLVIPLFCGWSRSVYSYVLGKASRRHRKTTDKVSYRAPCGKTFHDEENISTFLKTTDSNLTIDLFCFDPDIDILNVVTVDPSAVIEDDYSNGNEFFKIPAVNTLDQEKPPKIVYGARRFPFNENVDISTINTNFCSGCTCNGDCSDASRCECQRLTASNVHRLARSFRPSDKDFGYSFRSLNGKTISGIFECNENCSCNKKKCFNRVVQHDIKYPLQLFKTAGCGWGVRTLCDIPSGTFIANYVGALMTDAIADLDSFKGQDAYFADLDLNDVVEGEKATAVSMFGYLDTGIVSDDDLVADDDDDVKVPHDNEASDSDSDDGGRLRKRRRPSSQDEGSPPAEKRPRRRKMNDAELRKMNNVPDVPQKVFKWEDYFGEKESLFVIDAKNKGNIGRFLNHCCDPNVHVQHVLVDTHDLRLPWSAFFARRNIKAGEELCWNYGYQVDNIDQNRPESLQLICECGAPNCQGRLI